MNYIQLALFIVIFTLSLTANTSARISTETRIRQFGYLAETHQVQTSDGYLLQMFRILSRKNVSNILAAETATRPIAFLMHGLLSSSDGWILNGPEEGLAFALWDAGYDVWLGNCRGNTYSRKHVTFNPMFPRFWNFDWHHMGIYDLPAMIDYILFNTNETSLHYIGHSQGTTTLLVMLSMIPQYNAKLKTVQLLAPVAYMANMKSPLAKVLAPLMGRPSAIANLIGSAEFMPTNYMTDLLGAQACKDTSPVQFICYNSIFLICGFGIDNMNKTLLPEIMQTHPAGASVNQLMHYLQEYRSVKFRQFDHGMVRNKLTYNRTSPPNYKLAQITAPIYMYYSDNDWLAAVKDVQLLIKRLPNVKSAYRIPDPKWNHLDFLWAINVKKRLYDKIINNMN